MTQSRATPPATAADFLTGRLRLAIWALVSTGLAAACLVLAIVAVTSIPLTIVWLGIPMLLGVVLATRPIAQVTRRHIAPLLGHEVAAPYRALPPGNMLVRWRTVLTDRAILRDLAWVGLNGSIGLALALVGIVEAVLDLFLWWLPPGVMVRVHAHLASALLSPTEKTTLAQRVQQLAASRADQADMSATELRRIERDLHDGAQARLVSLGINLAMAQEKLTADPEGAKALLEQAQSTSATALADLRRLVRGIHPPVLADRGLVGAVQALALAAPVPIAVHATLGRRLPAPIESAAYFALAEGISNVIKHSGAADATVTIDEVPGAVLLAVTDTGCGGADPTHGSGLAGIERRLAAFDGVLVLTSPPGGPTHLAMRVPL